MLINNDALIIFPLLIAGGILSVITRKLTPAAGGVAVLTGVGVYSGAGINGLVQLGAFFLLAVWATGHHKEQKAARENAPAHPEKRSAGQVIANGGIAALLGFATLFFPHYKAAAELMMAGALASATADTLASELGMVYGRRTFNILTLKKEPAGLNGVVSLEGTLAGMVGAFVIALVYLSGRDTPSALPAVVLGGVAGNLADSLLGAWLERKQRITNNMVNLVNTLTGAVAALLAASL